MSAPRGVLVVFAKAPRPGAVKTRMTPPLTPEEACELYTCLLADALEATRAAAVATGLEPVLAVHPPEAAAELARRAPPGFRAEPQRGGDLSERMDWAVREGFARGARSVVLRGSDSPALGTSHVRGALRALSACDVAFCPDRDGGYGLVALRRRAPGLFDHPMSTRSALEDTRARAAARGLATRLAAESFDLDTFEDLRWLAEARSGPAAALCVKTLRFLDESRLWQREPLSAHLRPPPK